MKLLFLLSCLLMMSISCFAQNGFKNPVFNVDLEPISNGERNIHVYPNKIKDLDYPNQTRMACKTLEDADSSISLKCIFTQKNNLGETEVFYRYKKFISIGPSEYSCPCEIINLSCQTLEQLNKEQCSSGRLCASKATTCGKTEPIDQN